jgi:hypothetical protein
MGFLYPIPISLLGGICDGVADEHHVDEQIAVYRLYEAMNSIFLKSETKCILPRRHLFAKVFGLP